MGAESTAIPNLPIEPYNPLPSCISITYSMYCILCDAKCSEAPYTLPSMKSEKQLRRHLPFPLRFHYSMAGPDTTQRLQYKHTVIRWGFPGG